MKHKKAIQCKNVSKSFGYGDSKVNILKNIDLDVHDGEFLMLVGPSGSGKTTLLSVIAGILTPDSGTCTVYDYTYNHMNHTELSAFRAKNIGFVFQAFNLIPTLTTCENVAIPFMINNYDRVAALNAASDMLNIVDIGEKADTYPGLLSGGQQQRAAIARAFIHKPSLVICDEPTSALDFTTGQKIVELMRQINKNEKTTFVIVTHDERILKYADRIIHLDDGRIV